MLSSVFSVDCYRNKINEAKMDEIEDRWLSMSEICKHLGISSDTAYKWIEKKGMPAHKIGRLWKFKKDEVDGWVRSGQAAD